ncbi:Thiamine biosynthesis protein ThiC [Roseovarius sp. EC-HK134]|nr:MULTISPECIES: hypothetical protein [unclassified Roseovarius]VVT23091.1 Thiamine biosynthesis protein ThiC [Roseovarius sp. EC-SD190]VVT23299.1 Thiamine biosynthesis protein ThiC [Roseovarius sp. EC-HK134]
MTNTIAIGLGGIVLVAIGADVILNDSQSTLFLGRKLIDLIEYVAFWR